MSKKRNLKKSICKVCGDIAAECVIACSVYEDLDGVKMGNIVVKVAELQQKTLKRTSFVFDKSTKAFASKQEYRKARQQYFKTAYKSLVASFNTDVLEIVKEMNATLTPEQKEANKALAQK
jgi:putative heme degradation protein